MSIWTRALPSLASSLARPEIIKVTDLMHAWFAKLADDPERGPDFDRRLAVAAGKLQERGTLIVNPQHPERSQGAGFLLAAYAARYGASDPLHPVFIATLDRRAAQEGKLHCRWRGYVPQARYDEWRFDDWQRRTKLPNTGDSEKGRAA